MSSTTTFSSYEQACEQHRWEVPERYNIAVDVCDRHPRDKLAMIHEDFRGRIQEISWGELQDDSNRFANVLRAHGVETGDRVAMLLPPTPQTAAAFFGVWKAGAILLSMSVLYGDEGIRHRVGDSRPKVLLTIGDWGTGQEGAKELLAKVAARNPDVVIHLGDVYYSGTQNEVRNYFYAIWQKVLGIPKVAWGAKLTDTAARPATFHLSGNHDMYAGGQPYYTVIDMLGQPASYFCLRNEKWQFLAMDTGLHDSNPNQEGQPTWLEDSEVAWLKHKADNAEGRKTILLSHHQLFTAFEDIGKQPVNGKLLSQLHDLLPKITAWFWGHEHNLVIYKKYLNVLGRCIGHGAFPVAANQIKAPNPYVPIDPITLARDKQGFFEHGYVTLALDGPDATVTYYQYDAAADAESVLFTETL